MKPHLISTASPAGPRNSVAAWLSAAVMAVHPPAPETDVCPGMVPVSQPMPEPTGMGQASRMRSRTAVWALQWV